MKSPYAFSLFLFVVLLVGCGKKNEPIGFDYGKVENNKYTNSYFDCSLDIPAGWIVQSKEQMAEADKEGSELLAGDDKNLKAMLNASDVNTANLLSVNQFEAGSPVDYNPSFLVIAENLKNAPGMKSGSDYLFQARKLLKQSQLKYDRMDSVFEKEIIGKTVFYRMNAEISYSGVVIRQGYYSALLKGFSFNIIISYVTDEQKKQLMEVVKSLKFTN